MAKRRMFSLDVVDTDSFLDLPASSQSLYFHLGMRADDDGFVSSPKRITAMVGAAGDDLKLLIAKGFVRPDSRTEHLQRPQRPEEGHAAACQHRAQRTSWTAGRCSWRWPCSAWYRQRRYGVHYLGGDRSCAEILRRQCGRFQSQKGNVRLYRHARINKDPNAQPSGGGAELRRQCACV